MALFMGRIIKNLGASSRGMSLKNNFTISRPPDSYRDEKLNPQRGMKMTDEEHTELLYNCTY
jgi:hypothetical protein